MTPGSGHPAVEYLSAYLAGDVSERDAVAVRRHLAGCVVCGQVLDELGRQTQALGALDRPEPPVTMWAAIEGACEAPSPRAARTARAHGAWRMLVSGGCGLGLGAVAVTVFFLWGPLGGRWVGPGGASSVVGAVPVAASLSPEGPAEAVDPLLAEAESEFRRAARDYQTAAGRLRAILDREQLQWDTVQRARVAERLARLDEAVAHSQALARREPGDGARAEMLFAAYQRQIDFLAEVVHRGSSSLPTPVGEVH